MSFVRQHPLLWVFLRIMLLRQQPDILPASLFLFGLLDLDSPVLVILPFLLAFAGLFLALWGPFGAKAPSGPTATTSMDVGHTASTGEGGDEPSAGD